MEKEGDSFHRYLGIHHPGSGCAVSPSLYLGLSLLDQPTSSPGIQLLQHLWNGISLLHVTYQYGVFRSSICSGPGWLLLCSHQACAHICLCNPEPL